MEEYAKWEIDEWKDFQRKLNSAQHNVDSRPLLEIYEVRFRKYMNKLFDTEGMAGGSRWKELNAAYAVWKLGQVGHDKIGVLSGDMRESFTGGDGYESRITHDKMTVGPEPGAVPYTGYFSRIRPITISDRERHAWINEAEKFYRETIKNVLDPWAKGKSVRTSDGQLYTIDKSGKARIRNLKGQFVTKISAKLGFAAAEKMRMGDH
jgi:hypothetical protein